MHCSAKRSPLTPFFRCGFYLIYMCRYLKYTLQKKGSIRLITGTNIVNVLAFETLWFSARAIVKSQGSAPVQDSAGYCTNYCFKTKIEKFYLFNINWSRIPDGPRNGVGDLIMFVYFIIMLHHKTSLSLWNNFWSQRRLQSCKTDHSLQI